MNNTNNNPGMDQPGLAMLCGVVPPQYREGASQQFAALVKQADWGPSVPQVDEPAPADVSRLNPPPP